MIQCKRKLLEYILSRQRTSSFILDLNWYTCTESGLDNTNNLKENLQQEGKRDMREQSKIKKADDEREQRLQFSGKNVKIMLK